MLKMLYVVWKYNYRENMLQYRMWKYVTVCGNIIGSQGGGANWFWSGKIYHGMWRYN